MDGPFDESEWRGRVAKACSMRGLVVRLDAVAAITRQLRAQPSHQTQDALDTIMGALQDYLEQTKQAGVAVDANMIGQVVVAATRNDEDVKEESILIKSAFLQPKFSYDPSRQVYHHEGHSFPLEASADVLASLHRDRLAMVRARLLRNPLFAPPLLSSVRRDYMVLTPIDRVPQATDDALAASSSSSSATGASMTLLGTLTQPSEGLWCLEDESGLALPLDFSRAQCMAGMFTETAIVLVQGVYGADTLMRNSLQGATPPPTALERSSGAASSVGAAAAAAAASAAEKRLPGAFAVYSLAHPPAEDRAATLAAMAVADPLVVTASGSDVARERALLRSSPEAQRTMFVFASNVHLDSPPVLGALERMFRGFVGVDSIPALFVLMGNFTSQPFGDRGGGGRKAFGAAMDAFVELLGQYPEVTGRTRFVLVPGPRDPGASFGVLPQPPLPATVCGRLGSHPSVTLATNPVRIRFFSQEIVVFRGDITTPLRRRAALPLVPPPPEKSATDHMVRTVIDQGHLCPLPLSVRPIYWAYDHALRLSPTPDALVVGEDTEAFTGEYNGCCVFNPGSISSPEAARFAVYTPVTRRGQGPPRAELSVA